MTKGPKYENYLNKNNHDVTCIVFLKFHSAQIKTILKLKLSHYKISHTELFQNLEA